MTVTIFPNFGSSIHEAAKYAVDLAEVLPKISHELKETHWYGVLEDGLVLYEQEGTDPEPTQMDYEFVTKARDKSKFIFFVNSTHYQSVVFTFNDVFLLVPSKTPLTKEEHEKHVIDTYFQKAQRRRDEYWTPERKAEKERRDMQREQTKQELSQVRAQFPFEPKDPEKYAEAKKNNQDSYGARIYNFAEDWAALMDSRIAQGESLVDIAEECCSKADYDGITGFMYGCAVAILATQWKHGEELRCWRNEQYLPEGSADQGGVVNPAVLRVQ